MISMMTGDIQSLEGFAERHNKLEILGRTPPASTALFFAKLVMSPFWCAGEIDKNNALADINAILGDAIPSALTRLPFYQIWLRDMAAVAQLYCTIQNSDKIRFWLGTNRGCKRYHIDNVPHRLLVTYYGRGTEWLPDDAADREAYARGASNEDIVKNPSAINYIDEWDVAIFRGGVDGLLHRTPDDALNAPSVLMRLDNEFFGQD